MNNKLELFTELNISVNSINIKNDKQDDEQNDEQDNKQKDKQYDKQDDNQDNKQDDNQDDKQDDDELYNEFENFINILKKEKIFYEGNSKKIEKDDKHKKKLINQIMLIEQKMEKEQYLKDEAYKRRTIENTKQTYKINKKLGVVIYKYKSNIYHAYHTDNCKLVFNGNIYENIKEWLKLCFLVNIER